MEFKDLFQQAISEKVEEDSNDWGFDVYGEFLTIHLTKSKYTDLTEFEVKGSKTLGKFKGSDTAKGEYEEKDWTTIEKSYVKAMDKASKEVAKATAIFEKTLEKTFKDLEKFSKQF